MDRRHFLAGVAAATLGAAGLVSVESPIAPPEKKRFAGRSAEERRRSRFLNVTLTTHEGKQVRFYDDLVKDKTVLLNFFYTNCVGENLCPMATANLVRVQRLLGKRVGRDIFMYSITLDPVHDTPKVLKRYARGFGVRPGWWFLTGKREDIEALRRNLGEVDLDPAVDAQKSTHLGILRYGIEPLERWGGCPSLTRAREIARYVSWMSPKGERPDQWPLKVMRAYPSSP
jgi:protein SCO1/2